MMNKQLKKIILNESNSARDALEIIDSSDIKLVLIVNDSNKLLGTITDGDVRRFLLGGEKLDSKVSLAMNPQPISGKKNHSVDELHELMREHEILAIPILDKDLKVIDIEIFNSDALTSKKIFHNPVFLMAGGLGTRLQPLTNDIPKPMLQLGGMPLLEIILKNFIENGFVNFFISVQYLPDAIMDYFKDGKDFGVSIQYIQEEQPLGTGGALGLLPKQDIESPIVVMNGDILTSVDFRALMSYHNKHGGVATMCVRDYEYQVPFGVIEGDGSKINRMSEKPIYNCQVNAGIYIINHALLKSIAVNQKVDMTDILSNQISLGNAVHMFPIYEYWMDIGRLEDFDKAQIEYSSSN